ncbi:MAG: terminase gpA endonuclease subunit, partial [Alphaproteobacteria bacterium]
MEPARTWNQLVAPFAGAVEPPPERHTDEWAASSRVLPDDAAIPGPFEPSLTPFMVPFMRAFDDGLYVTVVLVCGSQMGKTDSVANVMGRILDDDPSPLMYVGPTRTFVEGTWEKRFSAMVESCASLKAKLSKGGKTQKKTAKKFGTVTARFAWAGSPTELAGDPARKVLVDEIDRMKRNVGGEGSPKKLADKRHETYADGQTGVTSTPTHGNVDAEFDPETGLEHWQYSDDVQSPVWQEWQAGTRHEWAWPCPLCGDYFIPRMKWLWWPEGAGAPRAKREAKLKCPNCSGLIGDEHKADMNARGRYVAPGQKVDRKGRVTGAPPEAEAITFWVSGLCSPWKTFGDRAASWIEANRMGDPEAIQTSINTDFGELYAISGDAPDEDTVKA